MTYKYIIIDGDYQSNMLLQRHVNTLGDFNFSGYVNNAADGLNLILEETPDVVFLGTNLADSSTESNFTLVNELYKYMVVLPKIVVISNTKEVAYEAMKYDVYDFILKPFMKIDIIKTVLKFKKENGFLLFLNQIKTNKIEENLIAVSQSFDNQSKSEVEEKRDLKKNDIEKDIAKVDFHFDTDEIKNELIAIVKKSFESNTVTGQAEQTVEQKNNILCVKSYGDYRFIEFDDIVYLKADNNSTDIMLNTGDSVTAFKTLKYFESSLPNDFVRIHNSHIINKKFVSRIHLGNSDCYLNKGKVKIPFSKSYKENINTIIELYVSNEPKEE
jgi:two-component system LytT family response regulator